MFSAQPAPRLSFIPSSLVSKSIAISVAPDRSLNSDGDDYGYYIAISINHDLATDLSKKDKSVKEFITKYHKQKLSEETSAKVEKDGVFTGKYCLHPITQKKIPIWIANYILDNYGTGVVMGVPAHDPRDFDFAKKFDFEIIKVIDDKKTANNLPNVEKGILINSSQFNGLQSDCLLYTSPSPRDQRGSGMPCCA